MAAESQCLMASHSNDKVNRAWSEEYSVTWLEDDVPSCSTSASTLLLFRRGPPSTQRCEREGGARNFHRSENSVGLTVRGFADRGYSTGRRLRSSG